MHTLTIFIIIFLMSLCVKIVLAELKLFTRYSDHNPSVIEDEKAKYEEALEVFGKKLNFSYVPVSPSRVLQEVKPRSRTLSSIEVKEITQETNHQPGENGQPVILKDNLKPEIVSRIDKGWEEHAFNEFVSDMIPLNRSLPDMRDKWCHKQNYSSRLPKASVVICFYNEAWSTLMRTVYSVINRTPQHLLKEIVLFDDFSRLSRVSTLEEDVKKLAKVKLVRASGRLGLIRARMQALKHVTAPVAVFLDSHCECTQGWLEPLLQRIAEDNTRVVSPVVDRIDDDTFEYYSQDIDDLKVGVFNWDQHLKFTWKQVLKDTNRSHKAEPVETPTISGGLFAISVKYFKKLGQYDSEFQIWGAENLELSFKTWMCGGSAEIVPCSHVGHVFRSRSPYEGFGQEAQRNMIRLTEVWLDDYKKYYYETIGNHLVNFGNVSDRVSLRKSLNCKHFAWYLNKFKGYLEYPDKRVARGQIQNMHYNMCLSANVKQNQETPVYLLYCHNYGRNQFWVYTMFGELKRNELCLDYVFGKVTLFFCRDQAPTQVWLYNENTKQVKNMDQQQCLRVEKIEKDVTKLHLETCSNSEAQKWRLENYCNENLSSELKDIMGAETF